MLYSYDDAVTYLERLVETPVQATWEAGLERTRLLLAHTGNPQERFATLHVTGSSGKGSTATIAASILRAAGYRTGLFTSPHLRDYTERIVVDGVPIAREDWTRLLNSLHPFMEEMAGGTLPAYTLGRPALLEVLWTLGALYFTERAVDVAVVEVGMGGRYDRTTINNARVGIITNVTLEHTHRLGPTIADIAYHKAGIVKRDSILVTAARDPVALRVIADECAEQNAALWLVTPDGEDGAVRYSADGAALRITTPARTYDDLRLSLLGRHQRVNAACAVGAVDALATLGIVDVGADAVARGLEDARMAGRLEWIGDDPPTLLDGAHNADAARSLAAALRELLPGARPVFLLGILGDKDIAAMVGALAPLAGAVVVTEPPWERRAGKAREVEAQVRRYVPDVDVAPDPAAALARAQELARARNVPLVVAGSLILVGAVRPLLAAK